MRELIGIDGKYRPPLNREDWSSEVREAQRALAARCDGRRIKLFDLIGIPKGWVVNGGFKDEYWEKINTRILPLRPGGILSPFSARRARKSVERLKEKHGGDVEIILVQDAETEHGWNGGPFLVSDLDKDPNEVLKEGSIAAKENNFILMEIKRRAYMAITGATDTK